MSPHHDAWHDDRIKEECGVVAVYTAGRPAAPSAFYSLFALQHRGQESAGIASVDENGRILNTTGMGLVTQIFTEAELGAHTGDLSIGHTRYSTAGGSTSCNAQPIVRQTVRGDMAVGHNGNLVNADELRHRLLMNGYVPRGDADSELITLLLAIELEQHDPFEAVRRTMEQLVGAYSIVVLLRDAILGFRDPNGVRPLQVGRIFEHDWLIASESCAFSPLVGKVEFEVEPGECVMITRDGQMERRQLVPKAKEALCLFEFIYFARPDSVMYGRSLYVARQAMGRALAEEHPCPEADIVVPVPDSGIPAALGFAERSGKPFVEGMVKSRYIHRTFIQPDQQMREAGVRMKLNPIEEHIRGKSLVLVDDSIVRGTTTGKIVRMLKEAGAREVHVRITAPPIMWPCFYGIDMAHRSKLIAANHTTAEICSQIEADSLGYLSLPGALRAVDVPGDRFCHACFSGKYPIRIPPQIEREKSVIEQPPLPLG